MADISQIKLPNGTSYDIADTTARGKVLPSGGTTGQILTKKSATDYDAEWTTALWQYNSTTDSVDLIFS